jgi:hypothetical protein
MIKNVYIVSIPRRENLYYCSTRKEIVKFLNNNYLNKVFTEKGINHYIYKKAESSSNNGISVVSVPANEFYKKYLQYYDSTLLSYKKKGDKSLLVNRYTTKTLQKKRQLYIKTIEPIVLNAKNQHICETQIDNAVDMIYPQSTMVY